MWEVDARTGRKTLSCKTDFDHYLFMIISFFFQEKHSSNLPEVKNKTAAASEMHFKIRAALPLEAP